MVRIRFSIFLEPAKQLLTASTTRNRSLDITRPAVARNNIPSSTAAASTQQSIHPPTTQVLLKPSTIRERSSAFTEPARTTVSSQAQPQLQKSASGLTRSYSRPTRAMTPTRYSMLFRVLMRSWPMLFTPGRTSRALIIHKTPSPQRPYTRQTNTSATSTFEE
jgi:hypothetical protein